MKLESIILNDFFDILNKIGADYCVMNNYVNMPEIIPSDVDFAIDNDTFGLLDTIIIKLAKKHDVSITQKIWHGYNKCAYILSPADTTNRFWLQLDFFVDFCAKGFPNLMPIQVMLEGKRKYKNFFVPITEVEVPFILQRRIFKGDIKEEHVETLFTLYSESPNEISKTILNIFGDKAGQSLNNFIKKQDINIFRKNTGLYRTKLKEISLQNTNLKYRVSYFLNQIKRSLYRLYYPTGISIGFIGKDALAQELLIDKVDSIISGSFHGTTYASPTNYFEYIVDTLKKVYWSKVIKRKVYLNLVISKVKWDSFFSSKIVKTLGLKPDIIIKDEYRKAIENRELDAGVFRKITHLILAEQAKRTNRHLMNKMSPTGKEKAIDIL